jgi:hypothetical protein
LSDAQVAIAAMAATALNVVERHLQSTFKAPPLRLYLFPWILRLSAKRRTPEFPRPLILFNFSADWGNPHLRLQKTPRHAPVNGVRSCRLTIVNDSVIVERVRAE